ncbi:ABC transporter permease [Rhodococcus pseudokoreensis]|uniref:ABC transporter permease n=1 Tax=Rhodococcus pseudokoreensis TaxID=2811421 RepID=A0A974W200_9NOCA|nr:ABC transporter permease [Rhodococcus pseudokoreensis]QSE89804.1 ABC transporter permease [Rhodococcus pseudokoreensis]
MLNLIGKRAGQGLLTIFAATILIFAILRLIPGDPAVSVAGPDASPATIAAVREQYGLDRPLVVQYGIWLQNLLSGDLGKSFTAQTSVFSLIEPTIVPTLWLVLGGAVLSVAIGFGLGIAAAVPRRRGIDAGVTGFASLLYGMPGFWVGLLLILVFGVSLKWLAVGGFIDPIHDPIGGVQSLILPWIVLAIGVGGSLSKFVRASYLEILEGDHIRLARSKGAGALRIVRDHVFRNALVPIVTVLGVSFAGLLGSAVVVESVFSWPGLGSLMVRSVTANDYPTVQAVLLIYVVVFVVVNFLVDLSYTLIDPRIRLGGSR